METFGGYAPLGPSWIHHVTGWPRGKYVTAGDGTSWRRRRSSSAVICARAVVVAATFRRGLNVDKTIGRSEVSGSGSGGGGGDDGRVPRRNCSGGGISVFGDRTATAAGRREKSASHWTGGRSIGRPWSQPRRPLGVHGGALASAPSPPPPPAVPCVSWAVCSSAVLRRRWWWRCVCATTTTTTTTTAHARPCVYTSRQSFFYHYHFFSSDNSSGNRFSSGD